MKEGLTKAPKPTDIMDHFVKLCHSTQSRIAKISAVAKSQPHRLSRDIVKFTTFVVVNVDVNVDTDADADNNANADAGDKQDHYNRRGNIGDKSC